MQIEIITLLVQTCCQIHGQQLGTICDKEAGRQTDKQTDRQADRGRQQLPLSTVDIHYNYFTLDR